MTDIISNDIQAYALAAVHAAVVLAVLWFAAWATFWRGTTETLARLDAELQRHKYQVSAGEAEVRRLGTLVRQFEERQTVEARPAVTAVPRRPTAGDEMAIRLASSGAGDLGARGPAPSPGVRPGAGCRGVSIMGGLLEDDECGPPAACDRPVAVRRDQARDRR